MLEAVKKLLRMAAEDPEMYLVGAPYTAGKTRSGHWAAFEKEHFRLQPTCVVTGIPVGKPGTKHTGHHVIPFHEDASLELDHRNVATVLTEPINVHFLIGHKLNWRRINRDFWKWARMILAAIEAEEITA